MTDYSELIRKARAVPGPTLLMTYPAQTTPDPLSNALAVALEAQAKEIAEKDAIIKELGAYVEHIAEQKLTEEMDADIREIADYEGAYNYMITDARDYLRAACAALKGT